MAHGVTPCEWRCEGCGDKGNYDFENHDLLGIPFHHCPTIDGPFDIVPIIHIYEKETTDGEEDATSEEAEEHPHTP